jgi:hypothetical protein
MDELGRDLEDVGRSIAPDLGAARRGIDARGATQGQRGEASRWGRRRSPGLRSAMVAAAVGAVMAVALGTTVALRHTGSGGPSGPVAVSGGSPGGAGRSTSTVGGAQADSGTAAPIVAPGGSGSASLSGTATTVPQTIQPLQTIPPATSTLSSTSATTSGPHTPGAVVVAEGTAGPVHVQSGQEVEVDLSASTQAWSEPQSSDQAVLVRISGSTSPDGSAHALFRAAAAGSASVFSAQAPPACYPHCLPPQRAFDVTVSVNS